MIEKIFAIFISFILGGFLMILAMPFIFIWKLLKLLFQASMKILEIIGLIIEALIERFGSRK